VFPIYDDLYRNTIDQVPSTNCFGTIHSRSLLGVARRSESTDASVTLSAFLRVMGIIFMAAFTAF
jgi:hypothetical protein